ncbi:MAG: DUF302 domain-containing protein [Hyphomicrobiales bacterium]|nr:DUF302 domain-containing protein [Hyphomicrobiales bacterium]MDE2017870.1 DUF302 domain-containing protein [Hyphomicrobiales bacterium]
MRFAIGKAIMAAGFAVVMAGSSTFVQAVVGHGALAQDASSSAPVVIKLPLADGVSPAEAADSLTLRANLLNLKAVGDLPLSDQVTKITGAKVPLIRVFLFCDPVTAQKIASYNVEFAAYLPCRISLAQDSAGKTWLVMLNLKPLIDQIPLGSDLRKSAEKVNADLLAIMKAGAAGAL